VLRRKRSGPTRHPHRAQLRGFHLEGFFLRRHDSLERWIPRTSHAFVDRHDRGQRAFDELRRPLELAPCLDRASAHIELRHRSNTRQAQELGDHRCNRLVCGIKGHAPEQDQVERTILEHRRECFGDGPWIRGNRVRFDLNRAVRSHRKRLSKRFLHVVGAQRNHNHLSGVRLLLDLNRRLGGVTVEVAHVELEPRFVHGVARRRNFEFHVHLRDAFHANSDPHCDVSPAL
jgi:hypothetical protein